MSRLLFAAARGARIEYGTYCHSSADGYEWVEGENLARMQKLPELYRIHPDDAHLAYGPISTTLREAAETACPVLAYSVTGFLSLAAVCEYTPATRAHDWEECWSSEQRSLFLLLLAEALADEGL